MSYRKIVRKMTLTRKKYYNVIAGHIVFVQYLRKVDLGDLLDLFGYDSRRSVERIIQFLNEFMEDVGLNIKIVFIGGFYQAFSVSDNFMKKTSHLTKIIRIDENL